MLDGTSDYRDRTHQQLSSFSSLCFDYFIYVTLKIQKNNNK